MVDSLTAELLGSYQAPDIRVVHARIEAVSADSAQVSYLGDDGAQHRGVIPLSAWSFRSPWSVGDVVVASLEKGSPGTTQLSMTSEHLIPALLEDVVPEVRTGQVRVMAVSREAGQRSKVCVATTVEGLDPVGACIGRGHQRVDQVKRALGGEKVDLVAWHPDAETLLRNAMQPAQVKSVSVDLDKQTAVVVVPEHQMAAAVGENGRNSQLAGDLVGVRVRVVSDKKAPESAD